MASAKEIIDQHQLLEAEAQELQGIEGTSIWQRIVKENEEAANRVFASMAFDKLPLDPMAALTQFMEWRSEIRSRMELIQMFTALKDRNATALSQLLGDKRPTAPEQEETDLDAGTY